ncbi:MAG: 4Fe-4S dicluster domain-containing protein [Candidatus Heimdallarchaeaceae archaeon]
MIKRIFADTKRCNGCRICELRCSFEHDKVFGTKLSRIRIIMNEEKGEYKPNTCRLCYKCIKACPENAISKNEKTGAIKIDHELCTCCGKCVEACPFNVMFLHPIKEKAITCDLCEGDPQCVKYCPEKVLFYTTSQEFKKLTN